MLGAKSVEKRGASSRVMSPTPSSSTRANDIPLLMGNDYLRITSVGVLTVHVTIAAQSRRK